MRLLLFYYLQKRMAEINLCPIVNRILLNAAGKYFSFK